MVRKCWACFKGCGQGEKITLHRFPKDEVIKRQWVVATGRLNFEPSKTSVLCSRHFTPECFTYGKSGHKKRIFIKPRSIPTIFPPIHQSKRSKSRSMMLPMVFQRQLNYTIDSKSSNTPTSNTKREPDINNMPISNHSVKGENEFVDYTDERSSSLDWVGQLDRNDNFPTHDDKESTSWPRPKQEIVDGDAKAESNAQNFKSRRKILTNLNMALNCIASQRRELKIVKQKNRLLEKRLSILKALLTHVLCDKIVSDESSESESEMWSG